jgi:SAM-dependent methyltransferase/uncharacterized protein YbaR (Trm112 family)
LRSLAGSPAPAARGNEVEVESGLLLCACERWFPIERGIPELLPDHLRDEAKDFSRLDPATAALPPELVSILRSARPRTPAGTDLGAHHKRAEIDITSKVDSPMFFAPGYTSPFAQWDSAFSVYLLKLFGAVAPLLALNQGDRVIDSGCGYAWTTEWLLRSGFDPIGVDICRTYLEVGVTRMGASRPHLVIADVENLPFAPGIARAVLAYESFHHIPDRARAMRAYERVLRDGGVAILAEPGAAHEQAQVAIDAMQKYGILEKGMELGDVLAYAHGTTLAVEQLYLMRMAHGEVGANANEAFVKTHSVLEGNLFRLTKGTKPVPPVEPAVPGLRPPGASILRRVWQRLRG